jgi:outer membrane protein assembly factor BamA
MALSRSTSNTALLMSGLFLAALVSTSLFYYLTYVPMEEARGELTGVKVGEIKIVGNEITSTSFILGRLGFYPGADLRTDSLAVAEKNLVATEYFVVDTANSTGPSVRILTGEQEPGIFRDILVQVQEKQ